MKAYSTDFSLPALPTGLPAVQAALARAAGEIGLSEADAARLELIVEELYVNTITHGQCADGSSAVDILLRRDADGVHLRYSDAAAAFDLAASPSPIADDEPAIGGLGITLIHGLCRHVSARHVDGRNIYELVL